jgi:hypothetical protein
MGMQIGVSNIITRAKSPTRMADKSVDDKPGKLENLLDSARKAMAGRDLFINDVIFHDVRVRCYTDSFHLADFWRENGFSPLEWQQVTGYRPPEQPQIHVYAFTKISEEPESAYYSRRQNTVVLFNTSYYGQLRSWALNAVSRFLLDEFGIHTLQASAVQRQGRGALFLGGPGRTTSALGLLEDSARLVSDDVVFVRYGYRRPNGQVVLPLQVDNVKGPAAYRRLENNRGKDATVKVLSLDNERFETNAKELDLDSLGAYAFAAEKEFYLRTNIVECFPAFFDALLRSRLENVPDVSPDLLANQSAAVDSLLLQAPSKPGLPPAKLRESMLRLYAYDHARAVVSAASVFGKDRVVGSPLEPVKIDAVFQLKRDPSSDTLVESLPADQFCSRQMASRSGYRFAHDAAEGEYLQMLEAVRTRTKADTIYKVHEGIPAARTEKPATLQAELELFRQLAQAARTYEANTIFSRKFTSKREAVVASAKVLARVLGSLPRDFLMTIHDFEG